MLNRGVRIGHWMFAIQRRLRIVDMRGLPVTTGGYQYISNFSPNTREDPVPITAATVNAISGLTKSLRYLLKAFVEAANEEIAVPLK